MAEVKAQIQKQLRYPWLTLLTLILGVLVASFWTVYTREDIHIGVGAEIILLSWGSLLITRRLSLLAKSMLFLGLSIPFLAASLTALYYPGQKWLISGGFWALFGLGVIPGLTVFFLGVFLYTELDKKGNSLVKWKDPKWITGIDVIFKIGALFTLATLFIGRWNGYTQLMVYGGITVVLICLIVLIPYRFTAGLRGAGKVMISLGVGGVLVIGIAFLIAKGKISSFEAMMGLIPTVLLLVIGFIILFSTEPRAYKQ